MKMGKPPPRPKDWSWRSPEIVTHESKMVSGKVLDITGMSLELFRKQRV